MNQAEKIISNTGNSSIKQNYDFEFNKLLSRLKNEFNGLFQQPEKEIRHNIDSKYYTTKKTDLEDEDQIKNSSRCIEDEVSNNFNLGLKTSRDSKLF